jgi:F-type H+-transporting ATPase subunit gamma
MASLRDYKRQIQSIQNTAKTTDALQTVSGVKLRRAESRANGARPYADNVEQMMRDAARGSSSRDPMMAGRDTVRRVAVLTLTSDRGLAGPFNANLLRRTAEFRRQQDAEVLQLVSGRKGIAYFTFRGIGLTDSYSGFSDAPSYEQAVEVGRRMTQLFGDGEADEAYLIYNRYQNAMVQHPVVVKLLPVTEDSGAEGSSQVPFEYVPDADRVLERLIPRYVETMIFQAYLESAAGEHGSRMVAMKNATDNANEMARRLTLEMNKARQAEITKEILEIAAGAEALSSG